MKEKCFDCFNTLIILYVDIKWCNMIQKNFNFQIKKNYNLRFINNICFPLAKKF